jgi:imidazolonepropionase-like amidohydrolase
MEQTGGCCMKRLIAATFFLSALSAPREIRAEAKTDFTAILGGTVITATGAPAIPDGVVLIEGNRIAAVGRRGEVDVPSGARVVDANGKFITPGLIETNVHLVLMVVPEFYVKYEEQLTEVALQAAQVALKYGVTTVMDSWGPLEALLEARDRINRGEIVASRVLVAGNIVGLGGPFSPYFLNGRGLRWGDWVHPMMRERINALWEVNVGPRLLGLTTDELANEIRAYVGRGVDFVKVAISAHGIGNPEPLMFSREALETMRDTVHAAGLTFQTHTATLESLRLAIELGVDHMQHPELVGSLGRSDPQGERVIPDAWIEEIKRKNIYCGIIPPSFAQERMVQNWKAIDHPDDSYVNELVLMRQLRSDPESFGTRVANVQKMLRGGVPFTLATDMGPEASELGPVGWGKIGARHFDALESLQEAGASPMDVIMGATKRGAEAYRLGDRLGTLEAGKIADLLVVNQDPLEHVKNLRDIRIVMKDGAIVERDSLPTIRVLRFDPEAPWPR